MSEASKTPETNRLLLDLYGTDRVKAEEIVNAHARSLELRLTEALDRAQRAEAALSTTVFLSDFQTVVRRDYLEQQSSKIAELEKALAEQNQPPKLYSTDRCGKHRGQGFILSGKTTPYLYPTCPLCEQEALASSGQGEGSSKG